MFLTSCCVIELPPRPAKKPAEPPKGKKLSRAAAVSPRRLTPGLSMKLASSAAIVAAIKLRDISSAGTYFRRPVVSSKNS